MKKLLTILFAVVLGFNLSAQTDYVETWDPDADGDGLIGVSDLLALLGVFQEEDMDDDGIWDSQDDCVGEYDECGVCNGPGAIYECGCFDDLLDGSCCGGPIIFEGYHYGTIQIGDQCWFAENLQYNPLESEWSEASATAPLTYELPEEYQNGTNQGARYNFPAASQLELCPSSWRVPTRSDIDQLADFLSTEFTEGEEGQALKSDLFWNGTNESGFNAVPLGDKTPAFEKSYWWTGSVFCETGSLFCDGQEGFYLGSEWTVLARFDQFSEQEKFAVRCIRD
ncbi:fibrobacter succinogenes major paralogous domain-containing protein [Flavobacteriales bacterium]|nr:fibrobacter succinogenes major paralogous domain-containing protein [Flavobacteriales bacterium]